MADFDAVPLLPSQERRLIGGNAYLRDKIPLPCIMLFKNGEISEPTVCCSVAWQYWWMNVIEGKIGGSHRVKLVVLVELIVAHKWRWCLFYVVEYMAFVWHRPQGWIILWLWWWKWWVINYNGRTMIVKAIAFVSTRFPPFSIGVAWLKFWNNHL